MITRSDLDKFVDEQLARFDTADRDKLRLDVVTYFEELAGYERERLQEKETAAPRSAGDVKFSLRTRIKSRARELSLKRMIKRLIRDFDIKEPYKEELKDAVYRAGDVYSEHDPVYVDYPKEQVTDLAAGTLVDRGQALVGGWFVMQGRIEAGTVVAFISGLTKVNDPWNDLVTFFRDMTNARVKYRLIAKVLDD